MNNYDKKHWEFIKNMFEEVVLCHFQEHAPCHLQESPLLHWTLSS